MDDDTRKPLDVRVADALDRLDLPTVLARDWIKALSMFGAEHPATLGCMLALVEEAVGVKVCVYRCRAGGWCLESAEDHGATYATDANADTRGEALVSALESAPPKTSETPYVAGFDDDGQPVLAQLRSVRVTAEFEIL